MGNTISTNTAGITDEQLAALVAAGVVPPSVSFRVFLVGAPAPAIFTIPVAKGSTGPYYRGGVKRGFVIPISGTPEAVLNSLDHIEFEDGTTLESSDLAHVSQPRRYKRDHEKAGQVIPGTGGNWTRSWAAAVVVGERPYTSFVTITATEKPWRVDLKLYNQAEAQVVIGEVVGFEVADEVAA